MVVAQDCRLQAGRRGQVSVVRTQIVAGREGGIEDVVRVGLAVSIAVHTPDPPGAGDELHRPDRPVIDRITVVLAVIGVGDDRVAHDAAVEPRAEDATARRPVGVQPTGLGVTRLGVPYSRQQPPRQMAGRVLGAQDPLTVLVGLKDQQRNAHLALGPGGPEWSGGRRRVCGRRGRSGGDVGGPNVQTADRHGRIGGRSALGDGRAEVSGRAGR